MAEQPDEKEIERLLKELRSNEAYRRKTAVDQLGELGVSKDEVIRALKAVANGDPNQYVRAAAKRALRQDVPPIEELAPAPSIPVKLVKPLSRNEIIRDFIIGFLGWSVITGAGWAATGSPEPPSGFDGRLLEYLLPLTYCLNIGPLIILLFIRPWIGFGMLSAFGINLLVTAFIGVIAENNSCFFIRPFYTH